jgi:hypothetical protein
MIMTLPAAGCVSAEKLTAPDVEVLCRETQASRENHAKALANDGGDASVVTGARLISQIDAACAML